MINYFLVAVVVSFCAQMFTYTSNLGKVRRVFEGLDYSVVQRGVHALQNETTAKYGPYFEREFLQRVVKEYFSSNLETRFNTSQYDFNIELTDPYIIENATTNFYKGSKITLRVYYFEHFIYSNSKKFVIKEKN